MSSIRNRRLDASILRQDRNEAEAEEYFRRKYGKSYRDEGSEFQGDLDRTPQQSLLPTVTDPKLWLVRCKPGKEREFAFMIMRRYFERQFAEEPLQIFSVVASDHIKGYIYVEATKLAHVMVAVNRIAGIFSSKTMLVPIKEMPDILSTVKKDILLKPMSWVRIKRGKFAGDLAQVIEMEEGRNVALLKIIPRIDLANLKRSTKAVNPADKRKKMQARPPARLFKPEELSHLGADIQKSRGFWIFNNERYKDGYLFKELSVSSLDHEGINPTLDEITRFQSGNDNEDEVDLSGLAILANNNNIKFSKGDLVEVIEGDLINLMGTVESVEGDKVTVIPKHEELKDKITFPAKQLRKFFRMGDHVKVIAGRHDGETGLIVGVEENIVTIFTDVGMKEIKVFSKDIQECTEVTSGQISIGQYELHDFIQLDPTTVGVIIKVDRETFRVLDQNGTVRTVRPQEISQKRNTKHAMSLDSQSNSIQAGDSVRITEGAYKDKQGSILHIYRSFAFLLSREVLENSNVVVVRTRNLVLVGSRNSRDSSVYPTTGRDSLRAGMMPPGVGAGRGNRRDVSLISKTVTIAGGPYKGYVGIVVDATDTTARIELHTRSKTITVDKSKLILEGGSAPIGGRTYFGMGDGGRTPLHPGMATPMHHGMQTPMHLGSQTPMHDGSRTPAYDENRSSAWDPGSRTPAHTPWSASTPRTRGPETPSAGDWGTPIATPGSEFFSASTPGSYNPSTPGAYHQPTTPGAGYDHRSNSAETPRNYVETPRGGYNVDTPGGYGYASTPGMTPALTPATPGGRYPITPGVAPTPLAHVPQTPFTPGGDFYAGEEGSAASHDAVWVTANIEVRVTSSSLRGGQFLDKKGLIESVGADNSCTLRINEESGGGSVIVTPDMIEPVRPSKKDKVKLIRGELAGSTGTLIGIDGTDGIVKLDQNNDFKILSMNSLAKLVAA